MSTQKFFPVSCSSWVCRRNTPRPCASRTPTTCGRCARLYEKTACDVSSNTSTAIRQALRQYISTSVHSVSLVSCFSLVPSLEGTEWRVDYLVSSNHSKVKRIPSSASCNCMLTCACTGSCRVLLFQTIHEPCVQLTLDIHDPDEADTESVTFNVEASKLKTFIHGSFRAGHNYNPPISDRSSFTSR